MEEIRDHWFFPYFITAALRISSWSGDAHTGKYLVDRQTEHDFYSFTRNKLGFIITRMLNLNMQMMAMIVNYYYYYITC